MNKVRKLVSKNKCRYQEDNFDLDLTYITPKVIAMGYPSSGGESLYRNPADQVKKFFKFYHEDHFRIYNLCSEKSYPTSMFDGRVRVFGFYDHNPPPLHLILPFCKDVAEFLSEDQKNVIAVHCKAGKGRTGMMISALLVYAKVAETAKEAIEMFGRIRTEDSKGVTIPSQKRYVEYFEDCLKNGFPEKDTKLTIDGIKIFTTPHFDIDGGCDPYFLVKVQGGKVIYDSSKKEKVKNYKGAEVIEFKDINFQIAGDIMIEFWDKDKLSKDDKMFHFWFNTNFINVKASPPMLQLEKSEIDKACKDKKNKLFDPGFKVIVTFKDAVEGTRKKITWEAPDIGKPIE